ncbi:hypothetical protein ACLMNJ_16000 [Streptomyces seoulensis]
MPARQRPEGQRSPAPGIGIYRSYMVAVLNRRLSDTGCIRRARSDRRRDVITLTLAGRHRLERLDALITDAQQELLAPLTPEQREQLIGLLHILTGHHQTQYPRPVGRAVAQPSRPETHRVRGSELTAVRPCG